MWKRIIDSMQQRSFWYINAAGWAGMYLQGVLILNPGILGQPKDHLRAFLTYLAGFGVSVGLRYVYRRSGYRDRTIAYLLVITSFSSLFAAIAWNASTYIIKFAFFGQPLKEFIETHVSPAGLIQGTLAYGMVFAGWSLLYFMVKIWLELREQAEKASSARELAQQAQLRMLRYQLNPHFLFNSLNSIRALVDVDGGSAKEMITELSEFLRYSLVSEKNPFVPFAEEMEAIEHYLSIEKKRYGDKLRTSFLAGPDSRRFQVPCLIILPLVENAVKFGMQTGEPPVEVIISACAGKERFEISVYDSGRWIEPGDGDHGMVRGTGTGLDNVRKRLENIYGEDFTLESGESAEPARPGVMARIVIGGRKEAR